MGFSKNVFMSHPQYFACSGDKTFCCTFFQSRVFYFSHFVDRVFCLLSYLNSTFLIFSIPEQHLMIGRLTNFPSRT